VLVTPAIAVLAAVGGDAVRAPRGTLALRGARAVATAALVLVVSLTAACGMARLARARQPRLAAIVQELPLRLDDRECNRLPAPPRVDGRRILLPAPAGDGCVSFRGTLVNVRRRLRFFVARSEAPPLWQPTPASAVAYELAVDGRIVAAGVLGTAVARFEHVDLPAGRAPRDLRVVLRGGAAWDPVAVVELSDVGGS